ncbi:tetratricopeptide repeat protein [Plantactinospora sp. S1510]|uniref:Tetratricopeptide repeat protein n=1 Tax=Plantactinospora alkalitolerans TaxID=2789879 RepID=A0ABS0GNF7_9ACTN|nr:tetratricopeptide repeat protein [Plantactinospora alkalitolerans]MBF9127721.1 tetratricopeptide repeat protein [Plantactinospora alkalitolerans]
MPADDGRLLLRQLCDDLRLLRSQAGGPSLRSLALRVRLGKSQVGSIFNGRIGRLPDWEVVRGVIDGCRQYAQEHGRLDRLSVATGVEEFWRPRYALVDYALQQATRQRLPAPSRPASPATVPRQLPAAARHFAGRAGPLAALNALLDDAAAANTAVISAIGGTAGVGKTALAVYWAHQVADRFPDGQLYVNLRGFGPTEPAMGPAEVIRRFLDALDIPLRRIPPEPDALAALYRSELAGRRLLILLDNARDGAQVRPLLPGAAGCLVLVTSRDPLTGLVAAEGAQPVTVDLLTRDEARQLLARRLGSTRIAAEPRAVDEIITRCARLPLPLAIVAAHAATRRVPLRELAEQLRDGRYARGLLNTGDPGTDVHAVFAWSYRALTPAAARVFRLLGRHPGPDTTAPAVASLAALPLTDVPPLLAGLTRANLLTEPAPGRYACHDLLRAYATHLSDTLESLPDREAATGRILDHYLHTAGSADRLLHPNRDAVTLEPPRPGAALEHLGTPAAARAWLAAELPVLLAAVDHAAGGGHDRHAWRLAWILTGHLEHSRRWPDQLAVGGAAALAAGRLADPRASAIAHRILARPYIETGRHADARTHLERALDLDTGSGDLAGQAHDHHLLAYLGERQGRYAVALDHTWQALALYRRAGHRHGQASALNAVGWFQVHLGDHAQAVTACQEALALLRGLDDRRGEAATLDSLGYAYHHLGDYPGAVTCFRQAVVRLHALGARYPEASTLTHLGDSYQLAGRPGTARTAWRRALVILTELDHPDAEGVRARLATAGSVASAVGGPGGADM